MRGQKRFYSGEKRRPTLKTQVVVVRVRKRPGRGRERRRVRAVAVSPTFPGSTHDKKVFDRVGVAIPNGVVGYGDTAYIGTGLLTPRRKPRNAALRPQQRAGNRRVRRKRIAVEHGIGKIKVWRAAAERWRNPRRRHTLAMKNIAGLHNRMFAD
ncbi:MAG: transposase family protein [Gemmataceae bacterium]|nr:transposase family protein [Gemmataceae bacterium]